MNYEELVKALRWCDASFLHECDNCLYVKYKHSKDDCMDRMLRDAAAAIEALQAENADIREELFISQRKYDEFTTIASMQNAMLAKQLPKRGKWIEDATTYAGPGLSNYKCSLCGKICGTWRRGLEPSELPNWCGNCGADMRKMEVQE